MANPLDRRGWTTPTIHLQAGASLRRRRFPNLPRGPIRFNELPDHLRAAFLDAGAGKLDFWDWFVDEIAQVNFSNIPADLRPHVQFIDEPKGRMVLWKAPGIDRRMRRAGARDRSLPAPYPGATLQIYSLLDAIGLSGKSVAVVGSISPWIEAMLLSENATVTAVDFNPAKCEHPAIRSINPVQFTKMQSHFDAIFSYSSIEHDGLGRYGDPINPDGDLCAMDELRGVLKPDGILFLAVPMHHHDALRFNCDRLYGPVRFARLIEGWRVIGQTPATIDGIPRSMGAYWTSWIEAFQGKNKAGVFTSHAEPAVRHRRGEHPIWWLQHA